MRHYKILTILLVFTATLAQAKKTYNCNVLRSAIASKDFNKQFQVFDSSSEINLILIDTNRYYDNCKISFKNKIINFNYEQPYSLNKRSGEDSKGKIVILDVTFKRRAYHIRFWAPYNNATLGLKVIQQKGKYKVITESRGAF